MKPILALETTTRTGSVAILLDREDSDSIAQLPLSDERDHGQQILPTIDALLRQVGVNRQDLGLIAFDQGPGAFTGIRLACSLAQAMGFALQCPVVAVNALETCARAFAASQRVVLVALDARMQEVYFGVYGQAGIELQPPVLLAAADVPAFISQRLPYWQRAVGDQQVACLVGEGWQVVDAAAGARWYRTLDLEAIDHTARPQAKDLAILAHARACAGRVLTPERALPLYLRNKVAFTTEERAEGLGGNPKARAPQSALLLPMMPVDINEVVELERQSQAFPWSRRNFEDALAAGYRAWVLRLDGVLAAFSVAMVTPDDVHLLVIAVARDYRRTGLGARLVRGVFELAREHGVDRVLLEVRPSNVNALAFYNKLGFEQIGTRKGYYPAGKGVREDAWVLACALDEMAV